MIKHDDRRLQLIRAALAAGQAEAQADVRHLLPWQRLTIHLSPLIGETGFSALYGRAARLQSARHAWLTAPQASQSAEALLATLQGDLMMAPHGTAAEANAALLDTFTQLLAGLIGEALTIRLLVAAWGQGRDGAEEQK
ncbi:hypothetical protein E4L96_17395 [Massilia arenosa]|uniref:Uncharacterized protein n=1 Tax=Zemynaea arenosa TaxID=2561931 RepID=A0A4Y9S315_9BURK|nr:hypothetical protein [Massilia arenosa]TFW15883.1 hypothetical protein E4L96_17395 [Massilia arenosa]